MRRRPSAMDLALRDLAVRIELETRNLNEADRNRSYDTEGRELIKHHLNGLRWARQIAFAAARKVERLVPVDFLEFLGQVEEEAMARILQAEPAWGENGDHFPLKRPNEADLTMEIMRMFHECALLCGVMPEPRMPPNPE